MGHDLLAAAAMGEMRTLVRSLAARHARRTRPRTLTAVESVMQQLGEETLATVFVGRVAPSDDGTASSCSTAWPVTRRRCWCTRTARSRRSTTAARPTRCSASGTSGGASTRVPLEDGALLVLYTDGLVERRDQPVDEGIDHAAAGVERAGGADPETVRDKLLARMLPARAEDDVALLVLAVDLAGPFPADGRAPPTRLTCTMMCKLPTVGGCLPPPAVPTPWPTGAPCSTPPSTS